MSSKTPAIWFPAIKTGTGADTFTVNLAAALEQHGIPTEIAWLPRRAEYLPWSVPAIRPPEWANLVHVNSWLHKRFIPNNLPLVVTLHSCVHDAVLTPYKSIAQRLYHRCWVRNCEIRNINRAKITTAVSAYTKSKAVEIFDRGDVVSVLNWVDTNLFSPGESVVFDGPFRLLFVGSLIRRKGVDLLPKIMRRLGPDFQLRYTGGVHEIGRQEAIPPNMIPLGRVDDADKLIALYRESDALLFPSRLEGLSLALLEAQACGLPVITSDASSSTEVVVHEVNGMVCAVDDVDEFVRAARTLAADSQKLLSMRIASRERAMKLFSKEKAVGSYIELYESALA